MPDWNSFVKAMNYCMMKQFCALEKGGHMAVLVGDIKKRGKLYSMIFELIKPGLLESVIIKAQHNCYSDNNRYNGRFIPIVHEYLLILRKEVSLQYSALLTNRREADIRDMPGATWRDIVADAMEEFDCATGLERIYTKLDGYKRTHGQQHWKEKVRQTLQTYIWLSLAL